MCLESGTTSGQEIEIQNTSVVLIFATVNNLKAKLYYTKEIEKNRNESIANKQGESKRCKEQGRVNAVSRNRKENTVKHSIFCCDGT